MAATNWTQGFDRWFAIFFEVEGVEQMVVMNGLDAEMAHNRFNEIASEQQIKRTDEVAFGVASLLIQMAGRTRNGIEPPFTRIDDGDGKIIEESRIE